MTTWYIFGLKFKNVTEFESINKYKEYTTGIISRLYGYDIVKGSLLHEDWMRKWWYYYAKGSPMPGGNYCIADLSDSYIQGIYPEGANLFIILRSYKQELQEGDILKEIIPPTQEEINKFVEYISSKEIGNGTEYPVSGYFRWVINCDN